MTLTTIIRNFRKLCKRQKCRWFKRMKQTSSPASASWQISSQPFPNKSYPKKFNPPLLQIKKANRILLNQSTVSVPVAKAIGWVKTNCVVCSSTRVGWSRWCVLSRMGSWWLLTVITGSNWSGSRRSRPFMKIISDASGLPMMKKRKISSPRRWSSKYLCRMIQEINCTFFSPKLLWLSWPCLNTRSIRVRRTIWKRIVSWWQEIYWKNHNI